MLSTALISAFTLALYTASVSGAPIRDTLAVGDVLAADTDIVDAREYTLDSSILSSRDFDYEPLIETRARGGKAAPPKRPGQGKPAGPKKQNAKPNAGRPNNKPKPNAGGKPNAGRPNNKPTPNAGGRPNGQANAGKTPAGGRQNGGKQHQHAIWGQIAGGVHRVGNYIENKQNKIHQHVQGAAASFGNAAHAAGNAAQAYANKPGRGGNGAKGNRGGRKA